MLVHITLFAPGRQFNTFNLNAQIFLIRVDLKMEFLSQSSILEFPPSLVAQEVLERPLEALLRRLARAEHQVARDLWRIDRN